MPMTAVTPPNTRERLAEKMEGSETVLLIGGG